MYNLNQQEEYSSKTFIWDYVSKIKLEDRILEHLEFLYEDVFEFVEVFGEYSETARSVFLLDRLLKNSYISSRMENSHYSPDFLCFYDESIKMNPVIEEGTIKKLNEIFLTDEKISCSVVPGQYRTYDVWVGKTGCKIENAAYVPPESIYVENLMEQFVNYYNDDGVIDPFIKGAICHYLFTAIHPFGNGNGRVARLLQEKKTADLLENKIHLNFDYPLFNLSQNYELTRMNYCVNQKNLIFSLDYDNQIMWNKWFQYVLNMIDEQLYFLNNKVKSDHELLLRL